MHKHNPLEAMEEVLKEERLKHLHKRMPKHWVRATAEGLEAEGVAKRRYPLRKLNTQSQGYSST